VKLHGQPEEAVAEQPLASEEGRPTEEAPQLLPTSGRGDAGAHPLRDREGAHGHGALDATDRALERGEACHGLGRERVAGFCEQQHRRPLREHAPELAGGDDVRVGTALAILLGAASPAAAAAEPPASGAVTLVICAPGYPGSTAEAGSVMERFAQAVAAAAGLARGTLSAEYHETEKGGLQRLARPDAALLFAPLPFFLAHEADLRLQARAQAVMQGGEASETYSLVAGKGTASGPEALAGWEIQSTVAYAPRFVRGPALSGWGVLPATTRLVFSGAVLTGLRRAAARERVALLLDRAQAAGLASLPYAADLEVLTRSAPLPAFVVATVKDRVSPKRAGQLVAALLALASRPDGPEVLASLRLSRFVPLDDVGLKKARAAYAAVATP
jgi:hypothetical protein